MRVVKEEFYSVNGALAYSQDLREIGARGVEVIFQRYLDGTMMMTQVEGAQSVVLVSSTRFGNQTTRGYVIRLPLNGDTFGISGTGGTLKDFWVRFFADPVEPYGEVPVYDALHAAVAIAGNTGRFNIGGFAGFMRDVEVWVQATENVEVRPRARFADQWPDATVGINVTAGELTRVLERFNGQVLDLTIYNLGAAAADIYTAAQCRLG